MRRRFATDTSEIGGDQLSQNDTVVVYIHMMPNSLESERRAIVHYIAIRCPTSGERTVHAVAETSDAVYIRCCDCGLVRQSVADETGIMRKRRQTDFGD